MVFDKDILHFRRFSKYVAPVGNGQLLKLMALKLGNSSELLQFTLRSIQACCCFLRHA
jgi:hypothetical protein